VTQLNKQLSEHLVAAELARRGIVTTPFSGNVPDIDILAFKSGKSIPVQVKSAKTGNITVANVERDYLILKQEGNSQRVIAKKEMPLNDGL
jgi:predicted RecB family endonuclease|tara:strand:+ start:112 stop:384 length:273 start_codon:yes stop_codon:yes gene_type:complete